MKPEDPAAPVAYSFGPYRLDLAARQIYRGTEALPLTGKAFDTLLLLVGRHGRLVEKDELLSHVWPDTHVTEDSLTQSISVLRRTLGEDAGAPQFIATVPRRGYRFIAPVTVEETSHAGETDSAAGTEPAAPAPSTPPARPARFALPAPAWLWRGAVVAAVPAAILLVLLFRTDTPGAVPNERAVRFEHLAAPGTSLASGGVLSPDGLHLAFVAKDAADGRTRLWVRALETSASRALPGTEGAFRPFWSPDGQFLAFFADGRLKKVGLAGAPPQTLATVGYRPSGGAWSREGVLLYADRISRIYVVPEDGSGMVRPLTTVDAARQEVGHYSPQFLPDGRTFLYFIDSPSRDVHGTYVASLDAPDTRTRLLDGGAVGATFAPPDHLVYVRDQTLMAQPFDPVRLRFTGSPAPIGQAVTSRAAMISAAAGGLLTFGGDTTDEHLVWFDRRGREMGALPTKTTVHNAALSPDERQIVGDNNGALWLIDLELGTSTLIARGNLPVWSPDGQGVVYTRRVDNLPTLVLQAIAGEADERVLVRSPEMKLSGNWSRDGRTLAYVASDPETRLDIWTLASGGEATAPQPFLRTSFNEMQPRLSPDGRWMAYTSDETGSWEVYVQAFPGAGVKRAISVDGGTEAQWTSDGRELIYLRPDGTLMAVDVAAATDALQPGRPRPLFRTSIAGDLTSYRNHYVMTGDGQRFLINVADESTREPISVVVHWQSLMNR